MTNDTALCVPLALALSLLAAPARGGSALLFDGGAPEGNGNGIETTIRVLANDFVLAEAGSITSVEFWATTPAGWDGTVEYFFFESAGNLPAATPVASGNGVNVDQTPTGITNEYRFLFDLEAPLVLAPGPTYWFGLHLKQSFADDGNYAFWSTTTADVGETSRSAEGGDFDAWGIPPDDEAFRLYGVVPEPAAALQALAGIGMLLACRGRWAPRSRPSPFTARQRWGKPPSPCEENPCLG
jgi:hypothetical protein